MKILREPLLHFFLLGIAIFAAYAWLNKGGRQDQIVVTRGQQNNLIATFERTWQRPPTPAEFESLVRDFIRQEIAYREAGQMELDRDDIVIRRRLRQKLELLTEDLASLSPPASEELDAWFAANAEAYRLDPRYSFEQIYFSPDRRDDPEIDAAVVLDALTAGASGTDIDAAGDSISLPRRMRDAPRREVAATFGGDFADALADLPVGRWSGPVPSGYGVHLIRVTENIASRIPDRDEVLREVTNDFMNDRRASAVDALYTRLAEDYRITIEPLATAVE